MQNHVSKKAWSWVFGIPDILEDDSEYLVKKDEKGLNECFINDNSNYGIFDLDGRLIYTSYILRDLIDRLKEMKKDSNSCIIRKLHFNRNGLIFSEKVNINSFFNKKK